MFGAYSMLFGRNFADAPDLNQGVPGVSRPGYPSFVSPAPNSRLGGISETFHSRFFDQRTCSFVTQSKDTAQSQLFFIGSPSCLLCWRGFWAHLATSFRGAP